MPVSGAARASSFKFCCRSSRRHSGSFMPRIRTVSTTHFSGRSRAPLSRSTSRPINSNLRLEELSRDEDEMRKLSLVMLILLLPAALLAQAPAAPATPPATQDPTPPATPPTTASAKAPAQAGPAGEKAGKVAVIDLQKAITENAEGKKAQEKFMAEFNKKQKEFEEKQKAMTDAQTKLQQQDKVLGADAKAQLSKDIDKYNTELQRLNDDAQKDLGDLQQQLFKPIAEKAQDVLKSYSTENGFAAVFDISSQGNSIIYYQEVADITTEIIRRIDAAPPKPASATPAAPAAPKPPAGK